MRGLVFVRPDTSASSGDRKIDDRNRVGRVVNVPIEHNEVFDDGPHAGERPWRSRCDRVKGDIRSPARDLERFIIADSDLIEVRPGGLIGLQEGEDRIKRPSAAIVKTAATAACA